MQGKLLLWSHLEENPERTALLLRIEGIATYEAFTVCQAVLYIYFQLDFSVSCEGSIISILSMSYLRLNEVMKILQFGRWILN